MRERERGRKRERERKRKRERERIQNEYFWSFITAAPGYDLKQSLTH